MTTEHVSVPREFCSRIERALSMLSDGVEDVETGKEQASLTFFLEVQHELREMRNILSRATPSDELQGAFAECYTSENGLAMLRDPECGISTVARVKTDYSCIPLFLQPKPNAPRVVTDVEVERASKMFFENYYVDSDWLKIHPSQFAQLYKAMRAALESFATSLPAAIPPGYVVVPVEPTHEMCGAPDAVWHPEARKIYQQMLAAAPQAGERG